MPVMIVTNDVEAFIRILDECGYEYADQVSLGDKSVPMYRHSPCSIHIRSFSHPGAHDKMCPRREDTREMTSEERELVNRVVRSAIKL